MSVKKIVLRCLILTVIAWLCAFGAFYLGFLESLENVTYDTWYCGHFHIDFFCPNVSTRILYNDVVQVGEVIDYRSDLSLHDHYNESAQEIFNQI